MKKIFFLLLSLTLLASCGPHRMKCGARGICDKPSASSEKTV
ncbi:lipoprotein [Flavobacterium sp.]